MIKNPIDQILDDLDIKKENENSVKQALDELETYEKFQKFLKDEKGVDYTLDECYDIVQWFKNNKPLLNPTQAVLFHYGHREALFFMGEYDQMDKIYELYYALKHGITPVYVKDIP